MANSLSLFHNHTFPFEWYSSLALFFCSSDLVLKWKSFPFLFYQGGDTNNMEESTINNLFASGYDAKVFYYIFNPVLNIIFIDLSFTITTDLAITRLVIFFNNPGQKVVP